MRYFHIDFLRAVSILGMIAIHVYAYRQLSSLDTQIWNWMNFVVVGFVFCSGYALYSRYANVLKEKNLFGWYKKRIIRLLIPFYVFLVVYSIIVTVFPSLFDGFDLLVQPLFLLKSVFLLEGGLGASWLPLLFIELMILFPFLAYFWKHKRVLLYIYTGIALLSAGVFTIYNFPYEYFRWVMWLPWSLVIIFAFYAFDRDEKTLPLRNYITYTVIFGALFALLYSQWHYFNRSYLLINNKYPPNFYFLLYATFGSTATLVVSYMRIWTRQYLKRFVLYTSNVSYHLFFVHFIVLDFVLTTGLFIGLEQPLILTCIVIPVSLGITYFITDNRRVLVFFSKKV